MRSASLGSRSRSTISKRLARMSFEVNSRDVWPRYSSEKLLLRERTTRTGFNRDKLLRDGVTILEPADADGFSPQPPGATDRVDRLRRSQRLFRQAIQSEGAAVTAQFREFLHAKVFGPALHLHGTSLSASDLACRSARAQPIRSPWTGRGRVAARLRRSPSGHF